MRHMHHCMRSWRLDALRDLGIAPGPDAIPPKYLFVAHAKQLRVALQQFSAYNISQVSVVTSGARKSPPTISFTGRAGSVAVDVVVKAKLPPEYIRALNLSLKRIPRDPGEQRVVATESLLSVFDTGPGAVDVAYPGAEVWRDSDSGAVLQRLYTESPSYGSYYLDVGPSTRAEFTVSAQTLVSAAAAVVADSCYVLVKEDLAWLVAGSAKVSLQDQPSFVSGTALCRLRTKDLQRVAAGIGKWVVVEVRDGGVNVTYEDEDPYVLPWGTVTHAIRAYRK